MFGSLDLPGLVAAARTLYTNARDHAEVAGLLADPYGYAPEDYAEGLALVDEVHATSADWAREYAEQLAATESADQALDDLEALFAAHRRLARTRVERGSAAYATLGLRGRIPDADAEQIAAAQAFYDAIDADPALVQGVRGFTPEAVARGHALVEAARVAEDAQTKETGEAQRATVIRASAVGRLRRHAGELAEVAKIALADHPQLRESLGLRQR